MSLIGNIIWIVLPLTPKGEPTCYLLGLKLENV